jgi:hypothetical protein
LADNKIILMWLISFAPLLIVAAVAAVQFRTRLRTLDSQKQPAAALVDVDRYRPMLRLLSDEDANLIADPALRRKLRATRCDLFREYLRHLTEDYGKLLAGLRLIMTESSIDRPDLAKALARNRVLFAVAVCRVEFHLRLYALGIGNADVLKLQVRGLVDALDIMRGQFSFVESAVWGA